MHLSNLLMLVLAFVLAVPGTLSAAAATAALFPVSSRVKMLDQRALNRVLRENVTSMVAFVAPWCGHCQRMAPEYTKAAQNLHPIVKLYAVDCDADTNKRLCADHGVRGFPTVKLFPRGRHRDPLAFHSPHRTASQFYYFAKQGIPASSGKISAVEEISGRVNAKQIIQKPRAMLMMKSNTMPIMWSALANKYRDHMTFFHHHDHDGTSATKLGFDVRDNGQSKVLIYASNTKEPLQFKGSLKFDSLSQFFNSLIDGSADLTGLVEPKAPEPVIGKPQKTVRTDKGTDAEKRIPRMDDDESEQATFNTTPMTASASAAETARELELEQESEDGKRDVQEPPSTASSNEASTPDHIDAAETVQTGEVVNEPVDRLGETDTPEPEAEIKVERPPAETERKEPTSEHVKDEL